MDNYQSIRISSLAEEDRPREKLILKGKASLSDAELIAILIGSGTKSLSAVDLSKYILGSVGNDLAQLAKLSVKNFSRLKAIGKPKAARIESQWNWGGGGKEPNLKGRRKSTSSSII